MNLVLTEDQQMLRQTVRQFLQAHSPVGRVRELRDGATNLGYDPILWRQMAELGWVGLMFPEQYGGLGMDFADLCVVLEEVGRALAPEPFISTVLMAGQALMLAGSHDQKSKWLPAIADGSSIVTLAHLEPKARFNLHKVATVAEVTAGGFRISGNKHQVLDLDGASALIVPARTSGGPDDRAGITLFLVPCDADGVTIRRQTRVDGRNAALLELVDVVVPEGAIVGPLDGGNDLLEQVVDRATIGLAAEMLGAGQQAFDDTLAYLKERVQFGAPIGSFQALQHRAGRMFINIETARSAVLAAARTVDSEPTDLPLMASLAKARCNDMLVHITDEGVQMHGGVGMTDEYDIGLFMKRARVACATFGDASFHRDRWATLKGY